MNLIDQLAQIREMQGKDPLPDPTHIAGFGPGDAPTPDFAAFSPSAAMRPPLHEDPDEGEGDAPTERPQGRTAAPPSPLIRSGGLSGAWKDTVTMTTGRLEPIPDLRPPDLAVLANDGAACVARYKEHEIELGEKDRAAIELIVKRAIVRKVQELLPARVRRVARASSVAARGRIASGPQRREPASEPSAAEQPAASGAEQPAAPRRRGRRKRELA